MAKLVFVHVPKCGGSSFGAALRLRHLGSQAHVGFFADQVDRAYRGEARINADYALRQQALRRMIARGTRCICGHVQASPEAMRQSDHLWVTLLRAPEERFVSHYRYLQRHHPDPTRPATLEAFLDHPDAVRLASQYLYYFAGVSQTAAKDVAQATARAINTLHQFDLVGDLARPTAFVEELRRLCGWGVISWHRNAAPTPPQVGPTLARRIARICAVDRAIYDAVSKAQKAA